MAPVAQAEAVTPWSIVAVIFIALFVIILFGSALIVGYLHHQRKLINNVNPYPYGSVDWLDWERAASSQTENDALAIAALKAHLVVQEGYNVEADKMIDLLERHQRELSLQLRDERRKGEALAPEVYQRIYDEIHKPLSPIRPSLPPLIVNSTWSTDSSITLCLRDCEPTPVLLQMTKLRDVMRSNSVASPKRSPRLVQAVHFASTGTIIDPDDYDMQSEDESPPAVGAKPPHYQAC